MFRETCLACFSRKYEIQNRKLLTLVPSTCRYGGREAPDSTDNSSMGKGGGEGPPQAGGWGEQAMCNVVGDLSPMPAYAYGTVSIQKRTVPKTGHWGDLEINLQQ